MLLFWIKIFFWVFVLSRLEGVSYVFRDKAYVRFIIVRVGMYMIGVFWFIDFIVSLKISFIENSIVVNIINYRN